MKNILEVKTIATGLYLDFINHFLTVEQFLNVRGYDPNQTPRLLKIGEINYKRTISKMFKLK